MITEAEADQYVADFRAAMDAGRLTVDPVLSNFKSKYAVDWLPFLNRKWTDNADTAVPIAELKRIGQRITTLPEGFKPHPLVEKVIADRAKMARGEQPLDWGMGEHLAFASLLASGFAVRITGQDSGRGTFTHRHAVLHSQDARALGRRHLHPAAERVGRPGAVHGHRLGAVRGGGARLRVRLSRRPSRTRSSSGRRSSATSSTARRS